MTASARWCAFNGSVMAYNFIIYYISMTKYQPVTFYLHFLFRHRTEVYRKRQENTLFDPKSTELRGNFPKYQSS